MKKKNDNMKISNNKIFKLLTLVYTVLLLSISAVACFFAYGQKKEELLAQMDMKLVQLEQEYQDTIDNFWQLYMPIYEKETTVHSVLVNYFATEEAPDLAPLEKVNLTKALSQMILRDSQVRWIALYSDMRKQNYILFSDSSLLHVLPADFPYLDEMEIKSSQMEFYGLETLSIGSETVETYAICGGVPSGMGKGKVIAGYSITSLEQICKNTNSSLKTLNYLILSNEEILFDSGGQYDQTELFLPVESQNTIFQNTSGEKIYINAKVRGNRSSVISYTTSWKEIFMYSHENTPDILLIVLLFAIISIIIYFTMLNKISKEVGVIRHGLNLIGENKLEYRIPTNFKQGGLPEIADSINHMTTRLQENINRAYYYELKQKEAELSELQSKFNPHFLYNSLEMLRAKSNQNGDTMTAELIAQLAGIFRGFIGSKTFIPIHEELAFSKRYLSLFGARYGDRVQILYNIDTEVLNYGIIRNVFQPLIENYFVHGFDATQDNNYILFRGKSNDEQTLFLTIEDNGTGMNDDEIIHLNALLHEPIQVDTESYGLKNLHQRLQLFYGSNCGLSIYRNEKKGLSIQMILLKMTIEEYEQKNSLHSDCQ